MQLCNTHARALTSLQRPNEACYKSPIWVDYCPLKILITYITENSIKMILFQENGVLIFSRFTSEWYKVSFNLSNDALFELIAPGVSWKIIFKVV